LIVPTPLEAFVGAFAGALVDGQAGLDEAGRASVEAFGESGVPPTVFSWRQVRITLPLGLSVAPALGPAGQDGATSAGVVPFGGGTLGISVRYLESPQGSDDPTPQLPTPQSPPQPPEAAAPREPGVGVR